MLDNLGFVIQDIMSSFFFFFLQDIMYMSVQFCFCFYFLKCSTAVFQAILFPKIAPVYQKKPSFLKKFVFLKKKALENIHTWNGTSILSGRGQSHPTWIPLVKKEIFWKPPIKKKKTWKEHQRSQQTEN